MNEISLLETLDLYRLSGVDEVVTDTPVNRFDSAALKENPPLNAFAPEERENSPAQTFSSSAQAFSPAATSFPAFSAAVQTPPPTVPRVTAQSLPELKLALENFNGCGLKKTARNLVFGTGFADSPDVMIIGEAPGEQEDRLGEPFVGASGHLLDLMLKSVGLSRQDSVYITNVVPWRPPANRKPTEDEIAVCLPFLRCHITLVKPKVLLLLGGISLSAVLHVSEGITKSRGMWLTYEGDDGQSVPAIASFHPAYLLRSAAQKKHSWRDFLCLRAKLNELNG